MEKLGGLGVGESAKGKLGMGNVGMGEVSSCCATGVIGDSFDASRGSSAGEIEGRSGEGAGFAWVVPLPDATGVP